MSIQVRGVAIIGCDGWVWRNNIGGSTREAIETDTTSKVQAVQGRRRKNIIVGGM